MEISAYANQVVALGETSMKLELVSFDLCPYVQRSVITLKQKGSPYAITYIDLEHPPEWFDRISPTGRVPLLKVDEKTVLFESAVINEFIDETTGEPLNSKDPLQKALERAWIEFGSTLLMTQYQLFTASSAEEVEEQLKELFEGLARVEGVLGAGPYFRGQAFSLVDAAYAPLFMRLDLSERVAGHEAWRTLPRTRAWARSLAELPAVRDSVNPGFAAKFSEYCRAEGSPLF